MSAALDLAMGVIKGFEGCKLKAYLDKAGIWTCGWGITGRHITQFTTMTQKQADEALVHYVTPLMDVLETLITVPVTDNQLAALTSLAYNIGTSSFAKSSVLRYLNQKNYDGAGDAFLMWRKIKGEDSPGLFNRRQAERALFFK